MVAITDPAGTPPASGSTAAGQLTRTVASAVVSERGVLYVIAALNTASDGGAPFRATCFASFVKYSVSGAALSRQWPCKLPQSQVPSSPQTVVSCPGGRRTSAHKKHSTSC